MDLKRAWTNNKDKGDLLLFEDDCGASEFLFCKNLEQLLDTSSLKIRKSMTLK